MPKVFSFDFIWVLRVSYQMARIKFSSLLDLKEIHLRVYRFKFCTENCFCWKFIFLDSLFNGCRFLNFYCSSYVNILKMFQFDNSFCKCGYINMKKSGSFRFWYVLRNQNCLKNICVPCHLNFFRKYWFQNFNRIVLTAAFINPHYFLTRKSI